ncbi:MAG: hypothetical protein ACK2UY_05045 [Anaerolineae bacterium]
MDLSDVTAVGRPVDPRYPTNLAIAIVTALVAVAGAAWQWLEGAAFLDGARWGIGAGLAVFLAWALARELDPDHDLSAFVGAVLTLVALPFLGLSQLLPLFWIILAMRIVNRTVGLPARPLDSLAIIGLGLWLTWQAGWIYGLATAAALFLDGWLTPSLRRHLSLSGAVLVATIVLALLGEAAPGGGWSSGWLRFVVYLAGLMFLIATETLGNPEALCDVTGEPVRPARVRGARLLALITALMVSGRSGQEGLVALLPLWAAMLGVALYDLVSHLARAWQGSDTSQRAPS